MNMYTAAYISNNFFFAYVLYRMIRIFYAEKRVKGSTEFFAYVLYAVIISITVFFNTPPIAYLLLSATLYFLLTFLYESSLVKRFASTVIAYIILTCVELIINYATGSYIQDLGTETKYNSTIGITAITILTFCVVLLLENFVNLRNGSKIAAYYWVSIILIPFGSLTLLLNNLSIHASPNIVIINSIIILSINILWFYTYDRISHLGRLEMENHMMEQQNKSYERQLLIMRDSEEAARALRHDIRNHLASLEALMDQSGGEEASQYAETILQHLENKKSISETGLLTLDSLINYKLSSLPEEVKLTYQAHISPDLPIDDFDLTIILGNLIDNSLEALEKIEAGPKELVLLISYDKGRLVIQLKNNYTGQLTKALETTKGDKQYHGIGLKNVQAVVHKYNGTLDISFNEEIFSVEVILYLLSRTSLR